jgi:hypothetical protein
VTWLSWRVGIAPALRWARLTRAIHTLTTELHRRLLDEHARGPQRLSWASLVPSTLPEKRRSRMSAHADERIVVKSAIDDSGCTSTGADTKGLRAKREASAALARTRQPAPVDQCQPWNAAEHGRLRRHADPLGGQVLHIVFPVVIGDGKTVFSGERAKLTVELTDSYGTAAASCSRFTVCRRRIQAWLSLVRLVAIPWSTTGRPVFIFEMQRAMQPIRGSWVATSATASVGAG